jgi:hypothetical protein
VSCRDGSDLLRIHCAKLLSLLSENDHASGYHAVLVRSSIASYLRIVCFPDTSSGADCFSGESVVQRKKVSAP